MWVHVGFCSTFQVMKLVSQFALYTCVAGSGEVLSRLVFEVFGPYSMG